MSYDPNDFADENDFPDRSPEANQGQVDAHLMIEEAKDALLAEADDDEMVVAHIEGLFTDYLEAYAERFGPLDHKTAGAIVEDFRAFVRWGNI